MGDAPIRHWQLFFTEGQDLRDESAADDELLRRAGSSRSYLPVDDGQRRRPFFLDQDGVPHALGNQFFRSSRTLNAARSTNEKYARSLRLWFNFLELRATSADLATEDDLFDYKFWRRTDRDNPRVVSGNTWDGDLAALTKFYQWAERTRGVVSPIDDTATSYRSSRRAAASTSKGADVKWLSRVAYVRWRDVGILGIEPHGQERIRWKPRNEERDSAFTDGLYGTGLRSQEWASALVLEVPPTTGPNRWTTLRLADACAKQGRGRAYRIRDDVHKRVLTYAEGPRRRAIAIGRQEGLYQESGQTQVLIRQGPRGALTLRDIAGKHRRVNINALNPEARAHLLVEGWNGLEPACLWLNEDGSPRPKRAWAKTFAAANARVRRAGFDRLSCHPHMLRHSFALHWYAVGRTIWESRSRGMSPNDVRDFQSQFGDTWDLVKTMLGHSRRETTMNIYLEPFLSLDIELLLEHAGDDVSLDTLMSALRQHPRVLIDPVLANRSLS